VAGVRVEYTRPVPAAGHSRLKVLWKVNGVTEIDHVKRAARKDMPFGDGGLAATLWPYDFADTLVLDAHELFSPVEVSRVVLLTRDGDE
jgi:hypothetical protein